ncbi:MAG: hypothetical protein A2Y76_05760 [Planctomycetes bacterium RBG_13_60_9]|nr:MAG: hypothetical protein A2Y76_05760 [Planctomycetes bacterium RBG_13_60_9]
MNLGIVAAPAVISAAMQDMFNLSRVDVPPAQWHARVSMILDENDAFLDAMPKYVREHYANAPTTQIPLLGQSIDEYAIIARGEQTGAYVRCRAPYTEFEIHSQVLADRPAPLLFNAVLVPLVRDLLLYQGKVLMHAGCVATPNGDGLIFMADSGGGKTTTALSLFREGFDFVSDDLIAVFAQDGRICVEGIPKTTNLSPKTIGFFPELASVRKTLGTVRAGKAPVDPADLFGPDGVRRTARASSLVVVHVGPKGPRLIPRPGTDILQSLVKSHTFVSGAPISQRSLDVLWPLLEQTRAYELVTGFDPILMAETLAKEASHGRFGAAVRLQKRRLLPHVAAPRDLGQNDKKVRLSRHTTQSLIDSILGFSLDGRPVDPQNLQPLANPRTLAGLWKLMAHHRIDNHLARFLLQSDAARELTAPFEPAVVVEEARGIWRTQSQAAVCISGILGEAGIDAMFSRGPVFAREYFPEPWLRQCRDVDVLVRRESLQTAERVLLDSGYKRIGNRDEWLPLGELPFRKDGATIELHWNVLPPCILGRCADLDFDACWASRRLAQWEDAGQPETVARLETNPLLLSSCLHCTCEHHLDRLVRLVDIRQILRTEADKVDWGWIAAQAMSATQFAAVSYSLHCAHVLVQAPLPPEILRRFRLRRAVHRLIPLALPPHAILAGPSARRWRRILFRHLLGIT